MARFALTVLTALTLAACADNYGDYGSYESESDTPDTRCAALQGDPAYAQCFIAAMRGIDQAAAAANARQQEGYRALTETGLQLLQNPAPYGAYGYGPCVIVVPDQQIGPPQPPPVC